MSTIRSSFLKTIAAFSLLCVGTTADAAEGERTSKKKRKPSNSISRVCPNGVRSIPFGVLYKPVSDVSDSRGGRPVVLFTGSQKPRGQSISVFSRNGRLLCTFQYKASDTPGTNGGADHYYSGWKSGCGKTGSQLATAARAASSSTSVLIGWKGGVCLGPVNPASRVGGI